ncbi:GrpE-domain-containing protein [Desarmillaria tabescens]|uniref:GrpE protein homolog, mitochondrial n=1 Tax=Armillaria tabescens TaxID=1929756 RepID=A0AA39KIG9_ARMTA|nr:GrpE-domain-containing protein [Desarmillaria tabescens]KAK0459733.1 GrpE-domain-containing protein [Desarmillaria tabescens]
MSLYSLQLFRSCTASLSSRTLARSAAFRHPSSTFRGRRHYSDVNNAEAKPEAAEEVKEEVKEGEAAPAEKLQCAEELAKLKAKEEEVVDLTGRLRYLQADFLNFQRNAAREKEQTRDFAITRFASDLLETVDVLTLALKSVPASLIEPPTTEDKPVSDESSAPSLHPSPEASASTKPPEAHLRELYTGVELTQRQLLQTLFKYHVKPFDPTGDAFDPNRHEALYQAPIPGKEAGTVIDCQKNGYTIKDRVLRAAQVGVAQEMS